MELGPARILIVEDDPAVCELLQTLLEGRGYRTRVAPDGGAAQEALLDGDVDLVLLDVMLPEMDGLELCRQLRTFEGDGHVPIIMLTALVGEAPRHAGCAAGADDYVTKPFKVGEIVDRVQVWLRASRRMNAAVHS